MGIYFKALKRQFIFKQIRQTQRLVLSIAYIEQREIGDINFLFCDDKYLLKLNTKYLKHNTLTDILTFDYSENKNQINADIFISVERVSENAKKYKQHVNKELTRVIIHGVLHTCGYNDKTESQKKRMRNRENYYLKMFEKASKNQGSLLN